MTTSVWANDGGINGARIARTREQRPSRGGCVLRRRAVCPFSPAYSRMKRSMDLALCCLALPFALPIMAACALAIWLDDPGPVHFFQWRTGRGGHRFRMFKFRTMVRDAEALKQKYAHLNELSWPDFKLSNDPRITRVGRILRATSLDELPQLFNVLLGDMSLVGPRPTSFDASTYALWQTERLEAIPGVTGLWQISGRSEVDFNERLRLDIEYLERRSLWFDFVILLRTVGAVMGRRGAY
jgi:lipopolysaccharide/colanic/teichoic acid biosynthesis glycosyltransferase